MKGPTDALKLKSCKYCGNEVFFAMSSPEGGRVQVYCPKCGATTTWRSGFLSAVRAWNKDAK